MNYDRRVGGRFHRADYGVHWNGKNTSCVGLAWSASQSEQSYRLALIGADMDITTLLIIVVIVMLLGGGWYGRGRWY